MLVDGDFPVLPKHVDDVGLRLKARSREEIEAQGEEHLGDPELLAIRVVDDRTNRGEVFGVGQVFRRLDALRGTLLVRAGDESAFGARTTRGVRMKPRPIAGGGCGDRCAGGGNRADRAVGIGWEHRSSSGKRRRALRGGEARDGREAVRVAPFRAMRGGPEASLVQGARKAVGSCGPRTTLPAEGAFPFERPGEERAAPRHATRRRARSHSP